ncbi:MAG TPA: hypothetical protein VGN44_19395, partial [Candidatus Angelobacter sp.]
LQDAYPPEIKRKFYRIAALLEIAEAEFLSLRNQKNTYKRSVDIRVQADVRNIAIDPVSLPTLIAFEPVVHEIDRRFAAIAGATLESAKSATIEHWANLSIKAGFATLDDLRRALTKYSDDITEYFRLCIPLWNRPVNRPLSKGVCIFQLAMLLIGAQGEDKLREVFGLSNSDSPPWFPKQAAIAAEIFSKHKGP